MRHPVVRRGGDSRSHFVVWPASELLKRYGDSFQGGAELAGERRKYRGIDSTRQEHANRYIGNEMRANGICQGVPHPPSKVVRRELGAARSPVPTDVVPAHRHFRYAV